MDLYEQEDIEKIITKVYPDATGVKFSDGIWYFSDEPEFSWKGLE